MSESFRLFCSTFHIVTTSYKDGESVRPILYKLVHGVMRLTPRIAEVSKPERFHELLLVLTNVFETVHVIRSECVYQHNSRKQDESLIPSFNRLPPTFQAHNSFHALMQEELSACRC